MTRRHRAGGCVLAAAFALLLTVAPATAQDISINLGQGTGVTERAIQMIALLTVLSLAPSILVMMTSFTRIVVVLSLLRTALGTQTAPPNAVIVSLALFLTAFVMGPALQQVYDVGLRPLANNEITLEQAFERSSERCAPSCRRMCATRISSCSLTCPGSPPPPRPRRCRCAS